MNTKQTAFNEAKLEILDIIRTLGESTAMEISLIRNRTPECCSMNLLRYHRMGLLSRRSVNGRTKAYTITERGKERLAWLVNELEEF